MSRSCPFTVTTFAVLEGIHADPSKRFYDSHKSDLRLHVQEPFQRLAAAGRLLAYPYDGFWACMDTFKDKQLLEDLYARGQVPWEVWKAGVGALSHRARPGATK